MYHYRLVATSDAGTSHGADAAFTTVGVTLIAPALRVVYGRGILLAGSVPTQAGRRDRDGVRPEVRRGIGQLDRDGPDSGRRNVALSGEADDPHDLPGELEPRHERGRRPWASGRRSPFAAPRAGLLVDARRRRPLLRVAASSSCSGGRRPDAGSRSSAVRLNSRSTALFRPVTFRAAFPAAPRGSESRSASTRPVRATWAASAGRSLPPRLSRFSALDHAGLPAARRSRT